MLEPYFSTKISQLRCFN